jgi:VanZ family protein
MGIPMLLNYLRVYGIGDEIHQAFVPMRETSIYNIMADSIGSFRGAFLLSN